jgi:hypothetical protein
VGQRAFRLSMTTCVTNARSLASYDDAPSGITNLITSLFARRATRNLLQAVRLLWGRISLPLGQR